MMELLEKITQELDEKKNGPGNGAEHATRKIGSTRKISMTLPDEIWAQIDQKVAVSGNISSVLRELVMKQLKIEEIMK